MSDKKVADLLAEDHARLEERVRALCQPLDAGDLQAATAAVTTLSVELLRHMREEDEQLFPLFAARLLMVRPTTVLSREHRRIAALLRDVSEAIDDGELVRARHSTDDLLALLEDHHRREQEGLYSWADMLLGPEARDRLIHQLLGEAA